MTAFSVRLFSFLQGADFYRLHETAALLPGECRSWLDVGCGLGLMPRIASTRGYKARGIDRSAGMIEAARELAGFHRSAPSFACSGIETALAAGERFDMVSASSIVIVTADPLKTLASLEALSLRRVPKFSSALEIIHDERSRSRTMLRR